MPGIWPFGSGILPPILYLTFGCRIRRLTQFIHLGFSRPARLSRLHGVIEAGWLCNGLEITRLWNTFRCPCLILCEYIFSWIIMKLPKIRTWYTHSFQLQLNSLKPTRMSTTSAYRESSDRMKEGWFPRSTSHSPIAVLPHFFWASEWLMTPLIPSRYANDDLPAYHDYYLMASLILYSEAGQSVNTRMLGIQLRAPKSLPYLYGRLIHVERSSKPEVLPRRFGRTGNISWARPSHL